MKLIHPMTGIEPGKLYWPPRKGGVTGQVGLFGWTRRDAQGQPVIHKGIDWPCSPGRPIFAAHDGMVTRVGEQEGGAGYGQRVYVEDEHGNETRYAHLAVQFVAAGQRIRAGHCLGLTGRSGNIDTTIETHLHFEVRLEGSPVDPEWWLHNRGDRYGVPRPEEIA